jgi:hypothetical protein
MSYFEEKLEKVKAMHTSNFIFWIFGKFLLGLGIGILLPVYLFNYGWVIAGWLIIVFAVILQIPAFINAFYKKERFKSKVPA